MSARLTARGRRAIAKGAADQLKKSGEKLCEELSSALRNAAPRGKTGALRRSIRPAKFPKLFEMRSVYGPILNAKGRHKGWIDRALRRAVKRFER